MAPSPTSPSLQDEATRWLAEKLPDMEASLAPMVEVNSFTDNVEGGRAVGAQLRSLFSIEGLSSRVVASTRYADHLVFASGEGGGGGAPEIALVGHLDTVFPPGTFEGYRVDGDLRRGPGVLDMKGGLIVVAYALRAIAAVCGLARAPRLRVVIVADEEVGSPEGQAVIKQAIEGARACLVFESGRKNDAIITRRKGTGNVRVVAHGKAAHAGNAHAEGVNAIWALSRFVDHAQQLTDYERGTSVNVGKIFGGTSKNTVPEQAEAQLDLRFCTRVDAESLVAAVRRAAAEAERDVPRSRLVVEGGIARLPLERTEASAALMEAYAENARAVGLGAVEAGLIGGGSDASTSGGMGIASIDGLGPRGIGFHTKDEQIEVATLVTKAQALARFLLARPET